MFWKIVAFLVTIPRLHMWILRRAARTPYTHITSRGGTELYMLRFWLFNPYGRDADNEPTLARWPWLPSIRVHHILRPDSDRHLHDHPWNARTIVLQGWYQEERPMGPLQDIDVVTWRRKFHRPTGYTGRLLFGQYHRISKISPGGVWTLFFTWRKRGTWGFLVDGRKVPWKEYQ